MLRRGYTLVELLVVVVVLTILMTIVFRLLSVGEDLSAKALTLSRMHRLENALSGYYAAFGTYPPVKFHGEQNPFLTVDSHGIQNRNGILNTDIWGWYDASLDRVTDRAKEVLAWNQVKAACEVQPISIECPMPEKVTYKGKTVDLHDNIKAASDAFKEAGETSQFMWPALRAIALAGFDDGVTQNIGRHRAHREETDWRDVQLFKFGVLSYLLPRYMIMMNGDETFFRDYAQWTGNNELPADPFSGQRIAAWSDLRNSAVSPLALDMARVANIPSQAVCARWMANFEKSLECNYRMSLFGIDVVARDHNTLPAWYEGVDEETSSVSTFKIYSPTPGSTSGQYVLNLITIYDGWGQEFYYHSQPPYQGYMLWSAGPNQKTFPPWIARDQLTSDANTCISYWMRDDLMSIQH